MVKNGNNKESDKEMEMLEYSVKELNSDDKVRINGIAITSVEFTDKNENHQTYKQQITKKKLVMIAHINDGEKCYLTANEGTVIYKQIMKLVNDEGLELPVKIFDRVFTVDIAGSGINKYPYFVELQKTSNYENLFK